MLCPEVWQFPLPDSHYKEKRGDFKNEGNLLPSPTNKLHFAHVVSVVVPGRVDIPQSVADCLTVDCEYYKVQQLSLSELLEIDFLENFVKKGSLSALSIDTLIDRDDCVCLTPDGILILSLVKETYQKLGIEGKVSHFNHRTKDRYLIQMNIKDGDYNTKGFKRSKKNISQNLHRFDLIFSWEPPDEDVCPSSVASHLSARGYNVTQCSPQFDNNIYKSLPVPTFPDENDEESVKNLIEWVGMLKLKQGTTYIITREQDFLSGYRAPQPTLPCPYVRHYQWRGFYSVHQVQRLYKAITELVDAQAKQLWIGMYVHGFTDTPVAWGLQEHHYYKFPDNGYIIFLTRSGKYLLSTNSCSTKRYMNVY